MKSITIPRRPLGHTGLRVSVLGFGAAPLGGVYGDMTEQQATDAVHKAFSLGVNLWDTSPYYGATKSEQALGKALRGLPRDQIIIATKVGRYGADDFDFSGSRVTASVKESLARLQLEYVDIIQCHDIEFGDLDQVVAETIPALLALKAEGLVRHIGITGLPLGIFKYVLDRVPPGSIDAILSYCHYSLNDTTLTSLLPYLKDKGVGIIHASPLSMGLLSPRGPMPWHPAPEPLKEACIKAAAHAASKGSDLAHLALKFAVKNVEISTVLVGMVSVEEVERNVATVLQALEEARIAESAEAPDADSGKAAELDAQVLSEVQAILAPVKDLTWPSGRSENNSL